MFGIGMDDIAKGAASAILGPLFSVIDQAVADKDLAAKLKLDAIKLEQEGKLDELKARMSVMLAEAQSEDKWTSRARPTFLYVMYAMILAAVPMGILYAVNPEAATNVADGLNAWLTAIPQPLYDLFGWGFGGYVLGRSGEKIFKHVSKRKK